MIIFGRVDIVLVLFLLSLGLPFEVFLRIPLNVFPLPLTEAMRKSARMQRARKVSGTYAKVIAASFGSGTFGNTESSKLERTGCMTSPAP